MKLNHIILFSILALFIFPSCNWGDDKENKEKEPILMKKDQPRSKNDTTPQTAPVINIVDTTELAMTVIYVKDSALNSERLSQKLADIYGKKLSETITKYQLKVVGAPMAWYKSQKAPFFFEAGIPIEKAPKKKIKGFLVKKTGSKRALVAHYFGPYQETAQAYQAMKEFLKDNHKKSSATPYEIYVDDPYDSEMNLKDPYKVQTDIIFPYE
jgi:effector-binding domain-containing protein